MSKTTSQISNSPSRLITLQNTMPVRRETQLARPTIPTPKETKRRLSLPFLLIRCKLWKTATQLSLLRTHTTIFFALLKAFQPTEKTFSLTTRRNILRSDIKSLCLGKLPPLRIFRIRSAQLCMKTVLLRLITTPQPTPLSRKPSVIRPLMPLNMRMVKTS